MGEKHKVWQAEERLAQLFASIFCDFDCAHVFFQCKEMAAWIVKTQQAWPTAKPKKLPWP